MGTRATYQIDGQFFYIHWDGYEAGAAMYFTNMIQFNNELEDNGMNKYAGGYAAAFLRGNDRAELADSHDFAGDSEFRYNVFKEDGVWMVQYEARPDFDKWVPKGKYKLVDFINMNNEYVEQKVVEVKQKYGPATLMTEDNLKQVIAAKVKTLGVWAANGNDKGANWDNLKEELAVLKAAA